MRKRFPVARRVWFFAKAARENWLARHRGPANYTLHVVGIPLSLVGLALLFVLSWPWGVSAFALGYVLQWLGHQIEGNDMGELILVKRMLGLPVVAIAPQRGTRAEQSPTVSLTSPQHNP